jgi:hypothetical protein
MKNVLSFETTETEQSKVKSNSLSYLCHFNFFISYRYFRAYWCLFIIYAKDCFHQNTAINCIKRENSSQ